MTPVCTNLLLDRQCECVSSGQPTAAIFQLKGVILPTRQSLQSRLLQVLDQAFRQLQRLHQPKQVVQAFVVLRILLVAGVMINALALTTAVMILKIIVFQALHHPKNHSLCHLPLLLRL